MNSTISNHMKIQPNLKNPSFSLVQTPAMPLPPVLSMAPGGVRVSISQEGLAQYQSSLSPSETATTSTPLVSKATTYEITEIMANERTVVPSDVITIEDALHLFDSYINLGNEKFNDLVRFLGDTSLDGSLDDSHLLAALAAAGKSAGEMLDQLPKMAVEERNLFLSLAAGGDKEAVAGMVKISSLIGNTSLHLDFLNMANNLNDDDLADFIKAAAENPEDIAALVQQTKKLGGVDRDNFLAAAAKSQNLTRLLSHVKELDPELSSFLFSAARAGRAQGKLITLSNRLSEKEMEADILSMASTLSQKGFENYLTASVSGRSERSGLHRLTQTLKGEKRELFLKAAANGGQDTNALVRQVSKMGKSSASLGDFLNAASRTQNISGLISVVREAGDRRSKFLELAKDLHTADLENLIFAAKGMGSVELGKFVHQGNALSGIEKSHFFFGASKAGSKSHTFMNLINGARGQERKDLLLVLANEKEEALPAMIGRAATMADDQRIPFLAREKWELSGSERQTLSSAYVHLSKHLSAGEFNNFLRAADSASSQEDVDRLMGQIDSVDDRSSFLATAATAKQGFHTLLDLSERLIDEEKENFLGVAGKLRGESLENFLFVADSLNSRADLNEFVLFTDSLTGEDRTKMLKASVDAVQQDVLTEFMDLTNQLSGPSRSLFLRVAQDAGGQLGNFIEATQNFIAAERNSFMAATEEKGFHLMDLFEDDSDITYTLRDCCKEDIRQFVSAARATGFDPDLIFSHDPSGYKFRNEENSEYIQQYITAIEREGFDLAGNSYLMDVEPGMKLVGTSSGGIFGFLENAFASGTLLGDYVKPSLS